MRSRTDCMFAKLARMQPLAFLNTPGGDRTHDLRIWNPLLYQLSYRRNEEAHSTTVSCHVRAEFGSKSEPTYFLLILWRVCLRSFGQCFM